MNVVFVTEVWVLVVHVFASINVEVLSLLILDIQDISLNMCAMFSQISSQYWCIIGSWMRCEGTLDESSSNNPWWHSPSKSHWSEVWVSQTNFTTEPKSSKPWDSISSKHGVVKVGHSFSISKWHIIWKQIACLAIWILKLIEPVKTIIFNQVLSEPWSSWYFSNTTEVAGGCELIEHLFLYSIIYKNEINVFY